VEVREEHRQRAYRVRLEWGAEGAALLAAECAVVVVVDVLSFSTSVDVAVGRGAAVLPQRYGDPAAAAAQARDRGAVAGGDRHGAGPSLRPSSLLALAPGTRVALPSPNGATLCALGGAGAGAADVVAGCLRNAPAVAAALREVDGPVGLVPAGERWPDGTLRVAWEDALGAGAIAAELTGRSPEADAAAALFGATPDLRAALGALASGRELVADGFGADVALAAGYGVSDAVPRRRADGFLAA
jgi:2-phosphosulfolactate phosphatase